jgi:DNA polymerase-3 subunit beta
MYGGKMNFSVSRNELYKALQKIINVIPSKSTIEILYNILLIAEDAKLKIIATDLEITQIAWCKCKINETGSIALPGKLLSDILREMPNTDLEFFVDSNLKIDIKSSFGEYKLSGHNKNDFPNIPVIEQEQSISIKKENLKRMIEKTIFACSSDNLRPALTGVFCQIFNDQFRMVSTDGHRLVKIINSEFKSPDFQRDIIIPTRALNFVARNLEEKGEQKITLGQNHVLFTFDSTMIYTRIIGEPYPDYDRVIPVDNSKELLINRETLISSIKRVSLFSNPLSSQIKINISENKINIYAQDVDFGGEAQETVECQYASAEIELAYNAHYLLDIMRHIDTENVKILIENPDSAGLVYPSNQSENEELLMLIMPVRLSG